MPATDVQYRYVSLDADHDLSAIALTLSLDGITYATTVYQAVAPPAAAGLQAPTTGLTRYWWRILLGPGQTLIPPAGQNTLRGLLSDTPEILHPEWTINV